MKKALFLIWIFLLSISLLLGCQVRTGEVIQKNSDNANGNSKVVNNSAIADIKAVYLYGDYDEELYKLQNRYKEEAKVYNHLIYNQDELKSVISKYHLVKEGTGGSYTPYEDFFKDNLIIAIHPGQDSSSVYYAVTDVIEKGAWNIEIEKMIPEVQTEDIINRVIFIEMRKELFEKSQKVNINISEKKDTSNTFNKNELYMEDLALGGVKVYMSKQEVLKVIGEPDRIDENAKRFEVGLSIENNTTIALTNNQVRFIETLNPKYTTPRGLKVGDSKDKLIELYGEPSDIFDDKAAGNQLYSYDFSGEYYLFHAELKNNKIIRLQVNLVE